MIKEINVTEALSLRDVLLLDVRSEGEYSEATIPGAVNVPLL
ncbi:MAG: rhodanese-like domain-containing protein, partial [Desulfofundulus sp.]